MHGDTLTAAIFFASSGIALAIAAVNQAGWKHRIVIWGLLGSGALFFAIGIAWPWLDAISPALTAAVEGVALNPASWFTLLMFIAAMVIFSRPKNRDALFGTIRTEKDAGTSSAQEQAFRAALQATNGRLDAWAATLTEKIEEKYKTSIEVITDTNVQAEAAFKLKLQSVEEDHAAKFRQISQEMNSFSETIKWLERDAAKLVFFAVDLVTLSVLEDQIAIGSRLEIPLGPDIELDVRNERSVDVMKFIQDVQTAYGNSHRGMQVRNVISNAEHEAEIQLRELPLDQRPAYIDLLDFRRLSIIENCRVRLLAFLKYQEREKSSEIRRQRSDLLERLDARSKS
jgi:hypothetical protein